MRSPLETERLRLRPLGAGDEEAVFALLSDERVVRYMLFPLFTRERAHTFVVKLEKPPEGDGAGEVVLGIAERRTGEIVGLCGLVLRPELEEGETWYLLRPELWGRGLVTEAVRALLDYGFRDLALHRIWATCLPENPGSARVLEKLGFRREGLMLQSLRIRREWRDAYLYALLSSEWSAPPPGARR